MRSFLLMLDLRTRTLVNNKEVSGDADLLVSKIL